MFRTLDDFNDQPFHATGIGAILIFEGQNNRMVRCRNSENFPVIEIVQSPSAKKTTANFLFYFFLSAICVLKISYLMHAKNLLHSIRNLLSVY